jgi:hypothetical protein
MLKKTIDNQKLTSGKGDRTVSLLHHELRLLELNDVKQDFWMKQHVAQAKSLQNAIDEAIKRQAEENNNQDIYHHLLKRMKKTKIFLEIQSGMLNDRLKESETVLQGEKKKHLTQKESAMQAVSTFKGLKKAVDVEKEAGETNISELQRKIEKARIASNRHEEWKKYQETMFEAAVIEDNSAKNLHLKEAVALHRLWYSILTKIYERKKLRSQKLEEAFQRIKIATGIPEIVDIVANFLTKEQTYEALMRTVNQKEAECAKYKERIDEIQKAVDNSSNRSISDAANVEEMKESGHQQLKSVLELSQKKFLIGNVHSKVRNWMRLMITKFNKIRGRLDGEVKENEKLVFYVEEIRRIFKEKNGDDTKLGKAVEENRKYAVDSMIRNISKQPRVTVKETEEFDYTSLLAQDEINEKSNVRGYNNN